jgi:hypothetical protein
VKIGSIPRCRLRECAREARTRIQTHEWRGGRRGCLCRGQSESVNFFVGESFGSFFRLLPSLPLSLSSSLPPLLYLHLSSVVAWMRCRRPSTGERDRRIVRFVIKLLAYKTPRSLTALAARPTGRGQLAADAARLQGKRTRRLSRQRCRRWVLGRSLQLWAALIRRSCVQPQPWGLRQCKQSWRRMQSRAWTTRGPRVVASPWRYICTCLASPPPPGAPPPPRRTHISGACEQRSAESRKSRLMPCLMSCRQ